jgi:hypothetical protein
MQLILKNVSLTCAFLILGLIAAAPVYSGGIFFDQQQFLKDTRLIFNDSYKSPVPRPESDKLEKLTIRTEIEKKFSTEFSDNIDTTSFDKKESKLGRLKIGFSQVTDFSKKGDELYSTSDDKFTSKIVKTLPSLFMSNSKGQSLEKMGTLVEPQINFYFEF